MTFLSLSTLLLILLAVAPGVCAQSAGSHAEHHDATSSTADSALTEGEVRRINRDDRKITLRHAPIANLDMPEMTMVFGVSDPAMLTTVNVGDKVRFRAERRDGQLMVTHLESRK